MSEKKQLKDSRVCRVFFSSPFGGMEEEREELTRKYFPQIQHLCNSHGIQFVAVDMRWGITKEAGENAQVINICLRELDRSDFFVGFFGQRYGWHGEKDELLQQNFDNAISRYPWLDNYRDKSVTELEYLHGHLNSPGSLPSCIYFRDKAYDDIIRDEGINTGNKAAVYKYSAESEHSSDFMEDLKMRVKATEDKLLDLNLKYPDPLKAAELMFNCIWKYLTQVLLVDTRVEELSQRELQLIEHDAFLASHLTVFCRNDIYFQQLNNSIESNKHLLVSGVAGSGKSALLCNWIEDLKKKENIITIYHLIGSSPSSTRPVNILERILQELNIHVDDGSKKRADSTVLKKVEQQDVQTLLQDLQVTMDNISSTGKKQTVVIIDGLDKLKQANKTEKPLYWLPSNIPENIIFILSTIETDTDSHEELVTERQFDILKIKPLDKVTQQELCTKTLMIFGKELSPDQLQKIIDAEQTQNPLYLKITISEIVVFGYFRLLDKKIDSLIQCNSVEELFETYLKRLEEDYNVEIYPGNLVKMVMVAILVSHEGISEGELKEIFAIPDAVWSPLYFAMEKYIVQHSGLIKFGFTELHTAVEKTFRTSADDSKYTIKKMINYFEKKRQNFPCNVDLLNHDVRRCSLELPFLQQQIYDKEGLISTITDINIFSLLKRHHQYEIIEFWSKTGYSISHIVDLYLVNFDERITDVYLRRQKCSSDKYILPPGVFANSFLDDLRLTISLVQQPLEGIKVLKKQIQILENSNGCMHEGDRQASLVRCEYFLASHYVAYEDYDTAEPIHSKVIEKLEKLQEKGNIIDDSLVVLAMSYNDIGVICMNKKQYEKAEKYFYKSLEIENKMGLKKETAECWMNIGTCRLHLADLDKSLEFFLKTLKIYEEVHFGQLNHDLGALMTNIGLVYRRMDKLEKAEEYYTRSLKIKANALGWDNPDLSFAYMNLSVVEQLRENIPKALEYITKAEHIYEKRNADLRMNMNYRKTFENRLLYMVIQHQFEEAEEDYQKILDVLIEIKQMDYCLKGLHREMLLYYIRSEMYDKASKTAVAILDQQNLEDKDFIYLDYIDTLKPLEERPQRQYKYTLEHAFELWPANGDISRRLAINNYIPNKNTEKLLQHLEKTDKNIDGLGENTYVYACDWCLKAKNEELALIVLRKGHQLYPDSMHIIDKIVDILRSNKDYCQLLEILKPVTEKHDNSAILYIAGYSAIMQAQFDFARELLTRIITKESDPMVEKATTLLNSVDHYESETKKHNDEQDKKE